MECLDGLARITLEELAKTHFVKNGTFQNAFSTRSSVVVGLGKSAHSHIVRLMNSRQKGLKRMRTKVQWLCWRRVIGKKENLLPTNVTIDRGNLGRGVIRNWDKIHLNVNHLLPGNWVAYFQDMTPPKSILQKCTDMPKPIQRVKFTKAIARHTKIRYQNPSFGYICPGEPHQRSPNAPKFESGKSKGAREAAWKLAKRVLKLTEHERATFSHLRKTGACLYQLFNLRNENLLSIPERPCTWSAKRTWVVLKWILWRNRAVLR